MTIQETTAILKILRLTYPQFYKGMSLDDANETINLWAMMFKDDDVAIVTEAVKAMIVTLKYPPTIADIKEKIRIITAPPNKEMTEMEAWNIVYTAICNSNYYAQEYFDKFPPLIQRLVGTPKQLREWAQMEGDTVKSVIQSNFMRSFTARKNKESEYEMLPRSTKTMIEGLADKFKMIESSTEEAV